VALRLLYLIFVRLLGWLVLLGAVGCFQRCRDFGAAASAGGAASAGSPSAAVVGRSGGDRSVDTVAAAISADWLVRQTPHGSSLACRSGETTLDLQTHPTRTSADAPHGPRAGDTDGYGEPRMGLPENCRRARHIAYARRCSRPAAVAGAVRLRPRPFHRPDGRPRPPGPAGRRRSAERAPLPR
jgi:hypothetical protein